MCARKFEVTVNEVGNKFLQASRLLPSLSPCLGPDGGGGGEVSVAGTKAKSVDGLRFAPQHVGSFTPACRCLFYVFFIFFIVIIIWNSWADVKTPLGSYLSLITLV